MPLRLSGAASTIDCVRRKEAVIRCTGISRWRSTDVPPVLVRVAYKTVLVTLHRTSEMFQLVAGIRSFGVFLDHLNKTSRVGREITTRIPDRIRPGPERLRTVEHPNNRDTGWIEPDSRRNDRDTVTTFG